MIHQMILGLYRAFRRVLLPGLSAADASEMDELVALRVRDAAIRPTGAVVVWAREFFDLFAASLRRSRGNLSVEQQGGVGMGGMRRMDGVGDVRGIGRMGGMGRMRRTIEGWKRDLVHGAQFRPVCEAKSLSRFLFYSP